MNSKKESLNVNEGDDFIWKVEIHNGQDQNENLRIGGTVQQKLNLRIAI